jgi:hypothetical protein
MNLVAMIMKGRQNLLVKGRLNDIILSPPLKLRKGA